MITDDEIERSHLLDDAVDIVDAISPEESDYHARVDFKPKKPPSSGKYHDEMMLKWFSAGDNEAYSRASSNWDSLKTSKNDDSTLTPIRVGYIIYEVFNAKLAFIKSLSSDSEIVITVTVEPDEIFLTEKIDKIDMKKLIDLLMDSEESKKIKLVVSSYVKSTISATPVYTKMIKGKSIEPIIYLMHPEISFTGGINALRVCLVCWPLKRLSIYGRYSIMKAIMPEVDPSIMRDIINNPNKTSLLQLIQQVNEIYMGDDLRVITNGIRLLKPTEQLVVAYNLSMDYMSYMEIMISANKRNLNDLIKSEDSILNELTKLITSIKSIDDTKQDRLVNYSDLLSDVKLVLGPGSKSRTAVSVMPHSERMQWIRRVDDFLEEKSEFVDHKTIQMISERRVKFNIRMRTPTLAMSYSEPHVPINQEDASITYLSAVILVYKKLIEKLISTIDETDAKRINILISNYFTFKGEKKTINLETGGIRGLRSLTALSTYMHSTLPNVIEGIKDQMNLQTLRGIVDKMCMDREVESVQSIINQIVNRLNRMLVNIPEKYHKMMQSRILQIKLSQSFSQVWSNMLRMKGEAYEMLFADTWEMEYNPEDSKPTLMSIVRQSFPFLVESFKSRTLKHPEVREMKPDFYLVKTYIQRDEFGDVKLPSGFSPLIHFDSRSSHRGTSISSERANTEPGNILSPRADTIIKHELGSDKTLVQSVPSVKPVIDKMMEYADLHDTKGGMITEEITGGSLVIESELVYNENKEEIDEDGVEYKADIDRHGNWSAVKYEDDNESSELLILEVGYQTDQERKIIADISKWKDANQILMSLGIKVTIISAVDTSKQDTSKWWIKKRYADNLKRSIGYSFMLLDKNSPPELTEIVVSDVSSQKLRQSLRSGTYIRTPILNSDVMKYYHTHRQKISIRPSGVKLPARVESDLIQAQVFGATCSTDKTSVDKLVKGLVTNAPSIIKEVKASKYHVEILKNNDANRKLMIGWLAKDLENMYCKKCLKEKDKGLRILTDLELMVKINELMNTNNYCESCHETINTNCDDSRFVKDLLTLRTDIELESSSVFIESHVDDEDDEGKTTFDKFIGQLTPSKTQKQKRAKAIKGKIVERLLELNNLAGFKDKKGQIFISQSHRRIQRNSLYYSNREMKDPEKVIKNLNKQRELKVYSLDLESINEDEISETNNIESKKKEPAKFSLFGLELESDEEFIKSINKDVQPQDIYVIKMFRKEVRSYVHLIGHELSEEARRTIVSLYQNPYMNKKPRSSLDAKWIEKILTALRIEEDNKEFIDKIKNKFATQEVKPIKNDTRPIISVQTVEMYLMTKKIEMDWMESPPFDFDCVLFKELINETANRLKEPCYHTTILYIKRIVELLLQFKWFNRIVLYSKICQAFMEVCSEFSHSGIKMKKIPHTNYNLVVKVPEKKTSNMLCSIRDSNMDETNNENFYLNRRAAILGKSLCYCYIVCFTQAVQLYGCTTALVNDIDWIQAKYESRKEVMYERFTKCVIAAKSGNLDASSNLLNCEANDFDPSSNEVNEVLINLLVGFNISFGIGLGPTIALNSYIANKQLQSVRYPFLLGLSKMGYPKQMGAKLSSSRRRIEGEVSELFIKSVCYSASKNVENNCISWKETQFKPRTSLRSLMVFGAPILSDRDFVINIYLVHIYNKEIDDFNDGQIRVFTDFASRHVEWENELKKCIDSFNRLNDKRNKTDDENKQKGKNLQDIRLLLGIPKLDTFKSELRVDEMGDNLPYNRHDKDSLPRNCISILDATMKENEGEGSQSNVISNRILETIKTTRSKVLKKHIKESQISINIANQSGFPEGLPVFGEGATNYRPLTPLVDPDEQQLRPNAKHVEFDNNSSSSGSSTTSLHQSSNRTSTVYESRSIKSQTSLPELRIVGGAEISQVIEGVGPLTYRPVVYDVEYKPKLSSLISDIKRCISKGMKTSFSSAEMIQLAAEFSRTYYNDMLIDKARRSKRNFVPMTDVIETTSIISDPKRTFSLIRFVDIIMRNTTKKLAKLMKQRLDKSKTESAMKQKKDTLDYFSTQMLNISENYDMLVEDVKDSISSPGKMEFKNWRHQLEQPLEETLLNTDGNQLYYWVKAMARDIKKVRTKIMSKQKKSSEMMKLRSFRDRSKTQSAITQSEIIETGELVYKMWWDTSHKCMEELNVSLDDVRFHELANELRKLNKDYQVLQSDRVIRPAVSYTTEETILYNAEDSVVAKFNSDIAKIFNFLVLHVYSSPWTEDITELELQFMFLSGRLKDYTSESVLKLNDTMSYLLNFTKGLTDEWGCTQEEVDLITRYVITMFHITAKPYRYAYDYLEETMIVNTDSKILRKVKAALSRVSLENVSYDFYITIQVTKSKNYQNMKRLLGKSGSDRLPRSVRSKVLYELVKVMQDHNQSVLQMVAFYAIRNMDHVNFASLAPKGQLGDIRDLLVQETSTKLIHAVSELFAKSLLDSSVEDALVNPRVKEQILDSASIAKKMAYNRDKTSTTNLTGAGVSTDECYYVLTGSNDHEKWGPGHCTSTFNALDQQLLRDVPDWKNYMMLTNVRGLIKSIEIPVPSIEKVMNSYIRSDSFKTRPKGRLTKDDIVKGLEVQEEEWEWTSCMTEIIDWYIKKGVGCLTSYNHMGQGIHHAKSSLHGDVCRKILKYICEEYFNECLTNYKLTIEYAGSSDDLCLIFRVSGTVLSSEHDNMHLKIDETLQDTIDLWVGISKSLQMSMSPKSVYGSVITEMYSEFETFWRISPSVIKFVISTIINNTIQTPLTMFRSMFVSSQQAMYQSTPFLTNLCFCLMRQQNIIVHVESLIREYGEIMFKLPSSFFRLFVPKISSLMTNGLDIEDSELITDSLILLEEYCKASKNIDVKIIEGKQKIEEENGIVETNKTLEDIQNIELQESNNLTETGEVIEEIFKGDDFTPSKTEYEKTLKKIRLLSYFDNKDNDRREVENLLEDTETRKSDSLMVVKPMFTEQTPHLLSVSTGNDSEELSRGRSGTMETDDSKKTEADDTHLSDHDENVSAYSGESQLDKISEISEEDRESDSSHSVLNFEQNRYADAVRSVSSEKILKIIKDFDVHYLGTGKHVEHKHGLKGFTARAIRPVDSDVVKSLLLKFGISLAYASNAKKAVALANLICMIISHYDNFMTEGIERIMKGEQMQEAGVTMEDPFTFKLPDMVRDKLKKLKLVREEVRDSTDREFNPSESDTFIASKVLVANNATETFKSEFERVKQIVNSRGIQNKLGGGFKENSIPFIKMATLAYFFNNKVPIYLSDVWGFKSDGSIQDQKQDVISGDKKTRFKSWLEELARFPILPIGDYTKLSHDPYNFFINPTVSFPAYSIIQKEDPLYQEAMKVVSDNNMSSEWHKVFSLDNKDYLMINGTPVKRINLVDTKRLRWIIEDIAYQIASSYPYNFEKIRQAENSSQKIGVPNLQVVVCKSKLFNSENEIRLENNPGLVVACLINQLVVEHVKPIGLKITHLELDKNALKAHYPKIVPLIQGIRGKKITNPLEAKVAINILTNFSRKLTRSRRAAIPFFAFKSVKQKTEDDASSLIKYGIIENYELLMEKTNLYFSTHSSSAYKILECISIISCLGLPEDKKSKLLTAFLEWMPMSSTNLLQDNHGNVVMCTDHVEETNIIRTLPDGTISSMLMAEARKSSSREREQIANIANISINQNNIAPGVRLTNQTMSFMTEGNASENGRFKLSCSEGNAVGIFMNGKLIVTLSQKNPGLLSVVEHQVRTWMGMSSSLTESSENIVKFLDLLPRSNQVMRYMKGTSTALEVRKSYENNSTFISFNDKKTGHFPVVFIKPGLLTIRKFAPDQVDKTIKLRWSRARLRMFITHETTELIDSAYANSIINVAKAMSMDEDETRTNSSFVSQDTKVEDVQLPKEITRDAVLLFHRYMYHGCDNVESSDIEAFSRFMNNNEGYPTQTRLSLINDKALSIIHEYALGKKKEKADFYQSLIRMLKNESANTVTYEGVTYYGGSMGAYTLNSGVKSYLGEKSPNKELIEAMLVSKKSGTTIETLDVPNTGEDGLKLELTNILSKNDRENRRILLQNLLTENFQDLCSFPHVDLLVDQLGMFGYEAEPKIGKIPDKINWVLVDKSTFIEHDTPKNIFSAIKQTKEGKFQLQMCQALLSQPVIGIFLDKINELDLILKRLPSGTSLMTVKLGMAFLIYLKLFSSEVENISYDWISFIAELLPISTKPSQTQIGKYVFRIIKGEVVCYLELKLEGENERTFKEKVAMETSTNKKFLDDQLDEIVTKLRKSRPNTKKRTKLEDNMHAVNDLLERNQGISEADVLSKYFLDNMVNPTIERFNEIIKDGNSIIIDKSDDIDEEGVRSKAYSLYKVIVPESRILVDYKTERDYEQYMSNLKANAPARHAIEKAKERKPVLLHPKIIFGKLARLDEIKSSLILGIVVRIFEVFYNYKCPKLLQECKDLCDKIYKSYRRREAQSIKKLTAAIDEAFQRESKVNQKFNEEVVNEALMSGKSLKERMADMQDVSESDDDEEIEPISSADEVFEEQLTPEDEFETNLDGGGDDFFDSFLADLDGIANRSSADTDFIDEFSG